MTMSSKVADRIRKRTGQTPEGYGFVGQMSSSTSRNGGPACGPMAPAQPQSWGAACPPGFCTSETLAANLGRQYAGERYPCRELTYWVELVPDAGGDATVSFNARVTICPTRVIALSFAAGVQVLAGGGELSVFEVGNQNQIVGDPIPLDLLAPDSYVIIPFVTDCIKAGMPVSFTVQGAPADGLVLLGLVGPAIG